MLFIVKLHTRAAGCSKPLKPHLSFLATHNVRKGQTTSPLNWDQNCAATAVKLQTATGARALLYCQMPCNGPWPATHLLVTIFMLEASTQYSLTPAKCQTEKKT